MRLTRVLHLVWVSESWLVGVGDRVFVSAFVVLVVLILLEFTMTNPPTSSILSKQTHTVSRQL